MKKAVLVISTIVIVCMAAIILILVLMSHKKTEYTKGTFVFRPTTPEEENLVKMVGEECCAHVC